MNEVLMELNDIVGSHDDDNGAPASPMAECRMRFEDMLREATMEDATREVAALLRRTQSTWPGVLRFLALELGLKRWNK